jgi:hypothetical protein
MKTAKSNPHAWFFRIVTGMEGYNKDFEKVIREGIVMEYSGGLTGSLSELYSSHRDIYDGMKSELTAQSLDELNIARKRVIAVLFAFLKNNEKEPVIQQLNPKITTQYVKAVARRTAKAKSFNAIPLNRLKSMYRAFGTKNTKDRTETERELIWSAMRKENRN